METPIYKIETFEGPLDLLLALVMKNKMDIRDIKITVIFDQYMAYIEQMKALDMEIAGEFIVMASELMFIKSRMLLPRVESEEEDPRERLAQALLEYKRAKEAAKFFEQQFSTYGRRMTKETDEIPADRGHISRQDLSLLEKALERLLARHESKAAEPFSSISPIIHRVIVPVSDSLERVVTRLRKGGKTRFENLFESAETKSEVVALFLAILTLVKEGHLGLEKQYGTDAEDGECEAVFYCSLLDPEGDIDTAELLKEFDS